MYLESDADRLDMIKGLGGVEITGPGGQPFWAVFKFEFLESLNGPPVEGRQPFLECRSSDVAALGIDKDTDVTVKSEPYRVRRHEPDGEGWSLLLLKRTS